jgi:hypothetical protein
MIEPALRKLRLDSRLSGRRGWIDKKDLEKELAALPDVSAKIAPKEEAAANPSAESNPGADRSGDSR